MNKSSIRSLSTLLPIVLAVATTTATPPPIAPAPKPAVIRLTMPTVPTAAAPQTKPLPVGQWMTQNGIPHTTPFVPEPILVVTRCN